MERNSRNRAKNNQKQDDKIIMYTIVGIAAVVLIIIGIIIYGSNQNDNIKYSSTNKITGITNSVSDNNTESASTDIGKTVEESKQNQTENIAINTNNAKTNNTTASNTTKNQTNNTKKNSNTTDYNTNVAKSQATESQNETLQFIKPVDGDIMTEFSNEQLIYSKTLDEWTTHLGIDIKADKTSIVKAAEAGTIKSIKNDPRYGLTVVIEHKDGFQTVYSNLLTAEFVVEGEKVEKGQTIGTVGNTASFEIADEPHLHFEILKDLNQVDPNAYIN